MRQNYAQTETNNTSIEYSDDYDNERLPWQFWVFGLFGAFYIGVLSNAYGYHWLLGSTVGFLGLGFTATMIRDTIMGRKILWVTAIASIGVLAFSVAIT